MEPKILIVFNESQGYLRQLAEAERKGIEAAGGTADIGRIAPFQITAEPNGHGKQSIEEIPIIEPKDLLDYDAVLFGISTAYGRSTSSEWRAFWDRTGGIWFQKGYFHKAAGVFLSSGTVGSAQENGVTSVINALVHHGLYFIPLGYRDSLHILSDTSEIHGGSAWGAGTFTGPDGLREPSGLELRLAEIQGKSFYKALFAVNTVNSAAKTGA